MTNESSKKIVLNIANEEKLHLNHLGDLMDNL
jgi:rubrerythrin